VFKGLIITAIQFKVRINRKTETYTKSISNFKVYQLTVYLERKKS